MLTTLKLVGFSTAVLGQFAWITALGALVGVGFGRKVTATALPEMVALLHSFVGFAAVFTSISAYMVHPAAGLLHLITAYAGVLIGGITATGSLVAFGKLKGSLSSKPLSLAIKNPLNLGMVAVNAGAMAVFLSSPSYTVGCKLVYFFIYLFFFEKSILFVIKHRSFICSWCAHDSVYWRWGCTCRNNRTKLVFRLGACC